MATTHEVRWAVSATPIAVETGDDGGHLPVETMHENIRKTVGGSGIATTEGAISQGGTFTDGVSSTPYLDGAQAGVSIGDATCTFIYVKNTGYIYDTATVLGAQVTAVQAAAGTHDIHIKVGSEVCAVLKAGEGMIFPLHGAASASAWTAIASSNLSIAVEAIGMD